jgi:hypothetical protein
MRQIGLTSLGRTVSISRALRRTSSFSGDSQHSVPLPFALRFLTPLNFYSFSSPLNFLSNIRCTIFTLLSIDANMARDQYNQQALGKPLNNDVKQVSPSLLHASWPTDSPPL